MRVKYDLDTKIFPHIGEPMDHSVVAYLHNTMFELACQNAISLTLPIPKGKVGQFCEAVKLQKFAGFSLTMPHKSDIIPFLDDCEEFSKIFNAVNRVNNINGKLYGIGLDGVGMRLALESESVKIKDSDVLIIGAGSVAGPIAAELCKAGAKSITVLNRTVDKAKFIADTIKQHFNIQTVYGELTTEQLAITAKNVNLVVQCTSFGMEGCSADFESVDFVRLLKPGSVVADVIFTPWRTRLLAEAERCGHKVVNGFGMTLHQQRAMMKFHFGIDLPEDVLYEAEEALLIALAMRQTRRKRLLKSGF
jgi:shikimate dehydrogenase